MIDSSADDGYGTEPLEKYSPTIGIDNEPLYPIPENTHRQRRRHLLGVLLVLAVIIIWVSSSILIQIIFLDSDFDKPFFLTYLSTSLFSVYLFGFAVKWKEWSQNWGFSRSYSTLKDEGAEKSNLRESADSINSPQPLPKLSVFQILSTLSGFFALGISVFLKVDTYNIWKLLAAVLTYVGCCVVCGLFCFCCCNTVTDGGKDSIIGDILTIIGAIFYALYCTLLKKRIEDESRLHMPMFFGFIGLINLLTLWPLFFIIHYTGLEPFEWPNKKVALFLMVNGLIGTVLSDILEAWSIILTTPLINTLGLSLSIPIAMYTDIIRKDASFTILYFFGSLLVFIGFVLVNLSSVSFEKASIAYKDKLMRKCKVTWHKWRGR